MTRCASAHDAAQSLYGLRADLCLCDAVGDGVEVAMSGHAHLLKWQWQLHHDGRLNIGPLCPYRRLERQLRCLWHSVIRGGDDSLYALQELSHFSENLIALGRRQSRFGHPIST